MCDVLIIRICDYNEGCVRYDLLGYVMHGVIGVNVVCKEMI